MSRHVESSFVVDSFRPAYLSLTGGIWLCSRGLLRVRLKTGKVAVYVALSGVMLLAIRAIPGEGLLMLIVRVLVGIVVYAAGLLTVDRRVRRRVRSMRFFSEQ